LYLLFTTFSEVYSKKYHWNSGSDVLIFLGMVIAMCVSVVVFGSLSDRTLKQKAGKGEMKTEYRLLLMVPATIFITAGLF